MRTIFVITDEDSFFNAVNELDDIRIEAASIQQLAGDIAKENVMFKADREKLSTVIQKSGEVAEKAVELQQTIFDLVEERSENRAT